jgi:hypothetical protein
MIQLNDKDIKKERKNNRNGNQPYMQENINTEILTHENQEECYTDSRCC